MLRSQLLLPDTQGSLIEGFRLRILALPGVEVCQATERSGRLRMVGAKLLLPDTQGSLIEGFRLDRLTLPGVEVRQMVEQRSHLGML
jgi:hypothetical protein